MSIRGFPKGRIQAMTAAFAKGEFFNTEIRGRFRFRRWMCSMKVDNALEQGGSARADRKG